MWEEVLFLVSLFSPILGETEIFDVTTVFKAGETNGLGRIHFRTNALGLPLYGDTEKIESNERSQSLNNTCDSFENICTWKMEGCSFDHTVDGGKFYHFNSSYLRLKFVGKMTDGIHHLLFTSGKNFLGLFHSADFHTDGSSWQNSYYITLRNNCKRQSYHRYTYNYDFKLKENGIDIYINCEYNRRLNVKLGDVITFDFGEYLQASTSRSSSDGQRLRNSLDINYFYLDSSKITLSQTEPYSCDSSDSEIISSEPYSSSTRVCLVIVLKSSTKESVLSILAEDSEKNRVVLETISDTKVGWNIVHLNATVPENMTGAVNIVIKKTTSKKILISRISSCNPDGEDVKLLKSPLRLTKITQKFDYSLITTTANVIEPVLKEISSNSTACLNGGVMTEGGCACPPGFFDSKCQLGCGRNRFGHDCGGLCSLREAECEGLLLCTNPTGCHCAPGYQGDDCKTKCLDGSYGNGCLQLCGHCKSSCDIYTGECDKCDPGYLPPLCRFESVYYPTEPLLTSTEYGIIKVSFHPSKYVATSGTPVIYQIQCKEKSESQLSWKTYINKSIEKYDNGSVKEMLVSEKVEGLKDGVAYQVRVLFCDENFYKYDGDLVRPVEVITKCEIPEDIDYKVEVESKTDSLFFSWSYDNTSQHRCPLEEYEVTWKESWKWFTNQTLFNYFSVTGLLSGATISFKVRAKTSRGFAPYSDVISASTIAIGQSRVRNLKVDFTQSTSAKLSWYPPPGNRDKKLQYKIFYKCIDQPACSPGCENISEGQMTTGDTSVTLQPLVPFTRYEVTVMPQNGPATSIYVGTSKDLPKEVPRPSNRNPLRTNTSLTVFWDQPVVCSSFLIGYNYQLVKELEALKVLSSGFTKNTSISFHNLSASTQYIVSVFVVTIAGWDPESYLAINVSTSATVPEAVRNVTVYKQSKGMLGLRWAPPRAVYGQLKSFTVTYTLGQDVTSHTVEPTPCVVWPELYCHTINGLRSNRRYNLTVSARNMEVPEDGEIVFVTGVTKENPPTAPQNLKMVNSTATSIGLQWGYPDLANGIVRSFLISVEETENYDLDNCCQIYPLVETFVTEEARTYETEVSGLHPASSYFVSVSAKTVGMGPSQSIVVQTRPPHLPLTSLPKVEFPDVKELNWQPQQTLPDVNNSEIYTPLIKAHLLFAVVNESQPIEEVPDCGIVDLQLKGLLETNIAKPFYFVAEYNQEDILIMDGRLDPTESTWGNPPVRQLPSQKYQLLAVQISEYNGSLNTDLRYSQPFSLEVVNSSQ